MARATKKQIRSRSTRILSLLLPLLFLVPVVVIFSFPAPGMTLAGTQEAQEAFLEWEATSQVLDIDPNGQSVIYFYECFVPGPAGNTFSSQSQAYSFLPGGVAITGQMSTHINQQNVTPSGTFPCTNPSSPNNNVDIMEFQYKFGSDLQSFTDEEPTNVRFSYDLSSFIGINPVSAAIVAWNYPGATVKQSLELQDALRQGFYTPNLGPVTFGPFGQIWELVLVDFGTVPKSGSLQYDFTAADLVTMAALPSGGSLAGIGIQFYWTDSPNRVGDPSNSFDFDAVFNHTIKVDSLIPQSTTVDSYANFLDGWSKILILFSIFAFEPISVSGVVGAAQDIFRRR